MPDTKDIIEQASSLPVEQRASVVDSLLKTLNTPDPDMDRKWADVAKRRLAEIRSGKVTTVEGKEVFNKIKERFSK